jgi:hypothetical protein
MALLKENILSNGISGTVGNAVFADTPQGTVVRSRPRPNNPNTEAQARQRYAFTKAQATYRTLTPQENAAWKRYALSPLSNNPDTGAPGGRTAYAAWISLSMRWIALHPDADPPRMPPEFPYAGDPIKFSLTPQANAIVLTATNANSSQTVTVVQWIALEFPSQSFQLRQMRVAAIHPFTAGNLTLTLPAAPGWYVVATHFVSTETGQYTASTRSDAVEVPTVS